MQQISPPNHDELELSVFGPGIGECVVLHLGGGEWIVVDSCLDETKERSIASSYLDRLNVDVEQQVKLVAVTHWHDDHIRGVAQLLSEARRARFACSGALQNAEFMALIVASEDIKYVEQTSGLSEFSHVLQILSERTGAGAAAGPSHWACANQLIYRSTTSGQLTEVHALSPSAQTITDSKRALAKLIPVRGESIRRFPSLEPNELSVAMLVRTPNVSLLLGADLDQGSNDLRGWRAVIKSGLSPIGQSALYKIAHHGSDTGDIPDIWTKLVDADGVAALTPYARGRKPLPSPDDVVRIKKMARSVYSTAWPATQKPPRRGPVDVTLKEVAKHRRAIRKTPGHIQVRIPINGKTNDCVVRLLDGATKL